VRAELTSAEVRILPPSTRVSPAKAGPLPPRLGDLQGPKVIRQERGRGRRPFAREYFCTVIFGGTNGKIYQRADAVGQVGGVKFRRCH
jgi:hypothetical protein